MKLVEVISKVNENLENLSAIDNKLVSLVSATRGFRVVTDEGSVTSTEYFFTLREWNHIGLNSKTEITNEIAIELCPELEAILNPTEEDSENEGYDDDYDEEYDGGYYSDDEDDEESPEEETEEPVN